jgi:hypothetical protein
LGIKTLEYQHKIDPLSFTIRKYKDDDNYDEQEVEVDPMRQRILPLMLPEIVLSVMVWYIPIP